MLIYNLATMQSPSHIRGYAKMPKNPENMSKILDFFRELPVQTFEKYSSGYRKGEDNWHLSVPNIFCNSEYYSSSDIARDWKNEIYIETIALIFTSNTPDVFIDVCKNVASRQFVENIDSVSTSNISKEKQQGWKANIYKEEFLGGKEVVINLKHGL